MPNGYIINVDGKVGVRTATVAETADIELRGATLVSNAFTATGGITTSGGMFTGDGGGLTNVAPPTFFNVSTGTISSANINTISTTAGNLFLQNSWLTVGSSAASAKAPITVTSSTTWGNASQYAYFSFSDDTVITGAESNVNADVSVHCDGRVLASSFMAVSDLRQKKEIKDLLPAESLRIVKNLKPKRWHWKDPTRGSNPRYGYVAQELQAGDLGQLISSRPDFLPDVFQAARRIDGDLFQTEAAHGLPIPAPNDPPKLMRVIVPGDAHLQVLATPISDMTIRLAGASAYPSLVVYGSYVPDMLSVDETSISALHTSAMQSLLARVETLERRMAMS